MGICQGSEKVGTLYYNLADEEYYESFGLTHKDLNGFASTFNKFDCDGDNSIKLVEFLSDLRLPLNQMTLKVFNLMDSAQNNHISFKEFVIFSWYFSL